MNRVYLHHQTKFNSLYKLLLILLSVFFLYGFYKNGLNIYLEYEKNLYYLFKPLIFLIISIVISISFSLINHEKVLSYNLLGNIMIALITLCNTNIIIYLILVLLVNFLNKYLKCNFISLYMVLVIIISLVMKTYTFNNLIENNFVHNYNLLDYLFGKGTGGVGNTFLIFTIISIFLLGFNKEYKLIIPFWGLILYYIFAFIYIFITKSSGIDLFLNNNLLFAFIFIAPFCLYSPYTKGAQYIYAVFLAIFTFVFSFLDINIGIYISILILSFLSKFFDKFIIK